MIKFVLGFGVLVILFSTANAQYDDIRCKCVCPPQDIVNGTETTGRKVYTKNITEPVDCKCENVVVPLPLKVNEFCPRCQCKWQRRNTTTIKVIVIIIICIVSILFLYMLFLLCLDPLLNRGSRLNAYQEHTNQDGVEEDDHSVHRVSMNAPPGASATGGTTRPRSQQAIRVAKDIKNQQVRWKGSVEEQRANVYDRHSMLN
ncbi:unnamed protein product [Owenia fusiformis]|uniref:Uncharacterized protein n=1 Tax=Owenia fusiformis TaxID=6347 RepID=A0A8J1TBM0_OWEFU|nr:unnamed protein product [Owenia fusiformis]